MTAHTIEGRMSLTSNLEDETDDLDSQDLDHADTNAQRTTTSKETVSRHLLLPSAPAHFSVDRKTMDISEEAVWSNNMAVNPSHGPEAETQSEIYPHSPFPIKDDVFTQSPFPVNNYPTSQIVPDSYPSNGYPNGDFPNCGFPSSGFPSNTFPSTALPSDEFPSSGYPHNDIPTSGFYPTSKFS